MGDAVSTNNPMTGDQRHLGQQQLSSLSAKDNQAIKEEVEKELDGLQSSIHSGLSALKSKPLIDNIHDVAVVVSNSFDQMARDGLSHYNQAMSGELRNEPMGNLRTLGTLAAPLFGLSRFAGGWSGAILKKMFGGLGTVGGATLFSGRIQSAIPDSKLKDMKTGKIYNPRTDA